MCGDPNPGTAFRVDGRGGYTVEPGYYFFKQVSRAGQPGMAVAEVVSQHPDIRLIAFSSNGAHPDAVTVINLGATRRDLVIRVSGSNAKTFDAYVTNKKRGYKHDGAFTLRDGALETTVFGESVVTFFAKPEGKP